MTIYIKREIEHHTLGKQGNNYRVQDIQCCMTCFFHRYSVLGTYCVEGKETTEVDPYGVCDFYRRNENGTVSVLQQ